MNGLAAGLQNLTYRFESDIGVFTMKLKDNLECTYCELCDWSYDADDQKYPTGYSLVFKFYGQEFITTLNTGELQSDNPEVDFDCIETSCELMASFKEIFETYPFKDVIRKICKEVWEGLIDNIKYDYKGELR